MTSVGRRFGAYLLDGFLIVVTLGIGWLIWSLIVWGRGQSPGKQLVGMYCTHGGKRASWGRMALRELIGKPLIWIAAVITGGLGIILYFWLCWDNDNQELWDKIADTYVVDNA